MVTGMIDGLPIHNGKYLNFLDYLSVFFSYSDKNEFFAAHQNAGFDTEYTECEWEHTKILFEAYCEYHKLKGREDF